VVLHQNTLGRLGPLRVKHKIIKNCLYWPKLYLERKRICNCIVCTHVSELGTAPTLIRSALKRCIRLCLLLLGLSEVLRFEVSDSLRQMTSHWHWLPRLLYRQFRFTYKCAEVRSTADIIRNLWDIFCIIAVNRRSAGLLLENRASRVQSPVVCEPTWN
jgi:hypothetical protein